MSHLSNSLPPFVFLFPPWILALILPCVPLVWHVILLSLHCPVSWFLSASLSFCRTPNVSSNGNPGYENLPLSDRQSPPPSVSSLVSVTSLRSVAFSWFIVFRFTQTDTRIRLNEHSLSPALKCFWPIAIHLVIRQTCAISQYNPIEVLFV